jgi:hypothetical protein
MFSAEDADLLVAACLLHDIGYAPNLAVTGFHPLDGALYLSGKIKDRRLCALVAHHSCARSEADMRGLAEALSCWVDERSPVRDALWWADMTTTPAGEPTNIDNRIDEIQQRYGHGDLVSIFIRKARSELIAAVERTEELLRTAGLGYLAK